MSGKTSPGFGIGIADWNTDGVLDIAYMLSIPGMTVTAPKDGEEMLAIENFGKKSLKEISEFLEEHKLRFGMKLKEDEGGRLFFLDEEGGQDEEEN